MKKAIIINPIIVLSLSIFLVFKLLLFSIIILVSNGVYINSYSFKFALIQLLNGLLYAWCLHHQCMHTPHVHPKLHLIG